MALIAVAADKGAPGVTTTAVALAAVWPRRALLVEADPAGGDLVYRSAAAHGGPLDPNTGLLSLAATARRGLAAEQVWDHAQPLAGGLEVLVGLYNSEQAAGFSGLWSSLGRAFAGLAESPQGAADVIADCGRIGGDTAVLELLPHASLVLLLARTEPEQLARVRDRAGALSARLHGSHRGAAQLGFPPIGILLVAEAGRGERIAGQVNDMLVAARIGARVVGTLADDPAGAAQLAGRRRGRVDRALLVRSARQVAADAFQHFDLAQSYGGSASGGLPDGRAHAAPPHAPSPQAAGPAHAAAAAYAPSPQPQPQTQLPGAGGAAPQPAGYQDAVRPSRPCHPDPSPSHGGRPSPAERPGTPAGGPPPARDTR